MPLIDLSIRTKNAEITTSLFGADYSSQNVVVDLGDDVTLGFKYDEVQRGFAETHFLLNLALSFPVSVASSVAARFIYDKLNSVLCKGDTVSLGKDAIVIERLDEFESKLTEKLDKARNQPA